jgi:hypothetical protein
MYPYIERMVSMKNRRHTLIVCLLALVLLTAGCESDSAKSVSSPAPTTPPASPEISGATAIVGNQRLYPKPLGIYAEEKDFREWHVGNEWRGLRFDRYAVIYAGAQTADAAQGGIVIEDYAASDDTWSFNGYEPRPTPRKHGPVKIVKTESTRVYLEASDGTSYVYDLQLDRYVQSSETLPLSFKPGNYITKQDLGKMKGYEPQMNVVTAFLNAWLTRDLTVYQAQFVEKPTKGSYAMNLFEDPSGEYAFFGSDPVWTAGLNSNPPEVCIPVGMRRGDHVSGEESGTTMFVCLQRDTQNQWKIYMID